MMQTLLTNVVETTVLERMRTKQSFTALDISNALKADRYPFRHREVAEVVRDIYSSGAMDYYDYRRELIAVTTEGGEKTTQAYLYHHQEIHTSKYAARDQEALPPVPADKARDLTDCVAAGQLNILPRPASPRQKNSTPHAAHVRQDGALAIPRDLIARLGWGCDSQFTLKAEPGCLTVGKDAGNGDKAVRVWGGQRVRICKTKLSLGALSAELASVEIVGDNLRIVAKNLSASEQGEESEEV
jgi:hypothetical protein